MKDHGDPLRLRPVVAAELVCAAEAAELAAVETAAGRPAVAALWLQVQSGHLEQSIRYTALHAQYPC